MRRMGHVEVESRQRFDRRPFQPMPRKIEQTHRQAPVDRRRTVKVRRVREAILPRAREDGQGEVAARPRSVVAGQQRPDELMGILTGAAPLDRKSTRLNSSHGYISYAVFCLK